MITIAHIVNPVKKGPDSDLYTAQPVTFETMKRAREFTRENEKVAVDQFAAYFPEDEEMVPSYFQKTKPLERSIRDVCRAPGLRKLPMIKDILDRLYEASQAEYFIYTNVDIALLPHFYLSVAGIIEQGYDAFIINRRTIEKKFCRPDEIPRMFSQAGQVHPGSDCFVFKRDLYPRFKLGDIAVGCYFFGLTMRANLAAYAGKFEHSRNLHLTFHIGDDRIWQDFGADAAHNSNELEKIFAALMNDTDLKNKELVSDLYRSFLVRRKELLNKSTIISDSAAAGKRSSKSLVFISLHKCATLFFSNYLLKNLQGREHVDYQVLHYDNNLLEGESKLRTRKYGYVYGVLRLLDPEHPSYEITEKLLTKKHLAGKKVVFFIRDPRDILVSMYYSFGFTHPFSRNPDIKEYQLKRRKRIQAQTIDEYVEETAPHLKEKFDRIASMMKDIPRQDCILLKYEDMINNFDSFYPALNNFIELNPGIKEKIFEQTRPRQVEHKAEHKRKGATGDYKLKLKKETISKINKILESTLRDFGYEIEKNTAGFSMANDFQHGKKPLLSVIVANYNNTEYLRECLDSIINQTYRPLEVVVYDDDSSDDSAQIIDEYVKKYAAPPLVIKAFYSAVNRGVARTRHEAILQASGEYITTLDSDDYYYLPQKLEKEMELVARYKTQENKDILAFSNIAMVRDDKSLIMFWGQPGENIKEGNILNEIISRSCMIPRDFIMTREAYFAQGGYDFRFVTHEDWDLKIRLAQKYEYYYSGIAGTGYRRHNRGLSSISYFLLTNDLWLVFFKNIGSIQESTRKTLITAFKKFMANRDKDFFANFKRNPATARSQGIVKVNIRLIYNRLVNFFVNLKWRIGCLIFYLKKSTF